MNSGAVVCGSLRESLDWAGCRHRLYRLPGRGPYRLRGTSPAGGHPAGQGVSHRLRHRADHWRLHHASGGGVLPRPGGRAVKIERSSAPAGQAQLVTPEYTKSIKMLLLK